MKRKILCLAVLCVFALYGAASASGGVKIPKVDNFYILMDSSGSMAEEYGNTGKSKIALAKELIRKMNEKIPELDYNGALYRLAPMQRIQPALPYERSGMAENIATLPGSTTRWFGYPTPLGRDLNRLENKMRLKQDRTAIIIFSDGGANVGENPAEVAKTLDKKYPDTFCFYPISLANRAGWNKRMQDIAEVNSCSKSYTASCFKEEAAVSALVGEIFYTYAPDSDGDGVLDENDRCPDTPAGAEVDKFGCALDGDNDGVINLYDECPHTPAGVEVDEKGCEVQKVEEHEDVILSAAQGEALFDVDKSTIKPEYAEELDSLVGFMRENPGVVVSVEGHTDSTGPAAYNKKLSERRAEAVKDYLVDKGIDAGRISTVGMGESQPVADNATKAGRRQNRRAVIDVISP